MEQGARSSRRRFELPGNQNLISQQTIATDFQKSENISANGELFKSFSGWAIEKVFSFWKKTDWI